MMMSGEEFTDPALRNILERPCEMRGERWDHTQTGQLQIVHMELYTVNKVLKMKSKSKWLGQWPTLADTLICDFQKQWRRPLQVVEDCEVTELGLAALRSLRTIISHYYSRETRRRLQLPALDISDAFLPNKLLLCGVPGCQAPGCWGSPDTLPGQEAVTFNTSMS